MYCVNKLPSIFPRLLQINSLVVRNSILYLKKKIINILNLVGSGAGSLVGKNVFPNIVNHISENVRYIKINVCINNVTLKSE